MEDRKCESRFHKRRTSPVFQEFVRWSPWAICPRKRYHQSIIKHIVHTKMRYTRGSLILIRPPHLREEACPGTASAVWSYLAGEGRPPQDDGVSHRVIVPPLDGQMVVVFFKRIMTAFFQRRRPTNVRVRSLRHSIIPVKVEKCLRLSTRFYVHVVNDEVGASQKQGDRKE